MPTATLRRARPAGSPVIVIAFSGGRDSSVLLHAAAAVWPAGRLLAAHVHHGLQPAAEDWLAFCRDAAAALGVGFAFRRLPPRAGRGAAAGAAGSAAGTRAGVAAGKVASEGVEGWARRLRYRALAEMAGEAGAELVLTAHHANDQLETVQLRRLRGAGPHGLAGMRLLAPLPGAPGLLLLRPFIDVGRNALADYADRHALRWVEDPSNQDPRFARNRIRRQLDAAIAADAAALDRGLAAIGDLQRRADAIRAQAGDDLEASRLVVVPAPAPAGITTTEVPRPGEMRSLSRAALARLPAERAAEAIRAWLAEIGCRMPSRAKLAEIVRQLLAAEATRVELRHDDRWLLRYRDRIDAALELPRPVQPTAFRWSGEAMLEVAGQRFVFEPRAGGIGADWLRGAELLLDRGRGTDRLRLQPGRPARTWKNLVQERGVPPWLRPALPVLRVAGRAIYAAPFGCAVGSDGSGLTRNVVGWSLGDAAGPARIAVEWVPPAAWCRWL